MGLEYLIQGKVEDIYEKPPNKDLLEQTILKIRTNYGQLYTIYANRHGLDFLLGQEISIFRAIVDYKRDYYVVKQVIRYYDKDGNIFRKEEFQEYPINDL